MFRYVVWLMLCVGMSNVVQADVRGSGEKAAGASIEHIVEYSLANGLRVVLAPDDKAQAIAVNLVYLTGSLADREGEGGAAHLLEHLMFKGTATLPDGQLLAEMTRRGIRFNATTSHDRTRYQAMLPADSAQLDWLLAMEADRMMHARFTQADLDKEIPVVLREMEIAQSNPLAAFASRLMAVDDPTGYGRHPLGTRGEVEKLTLQGMTTFYRTHYRPDNAVLILSGKFSPAQARASIQRVFGALPASSSLSPKAWPDRARPAGAVARQLSAQRGEASMAVLAYPAPAAADPLNAELGVLTDILAGNPHGRLHQALVARGQAVAVMANPMALRGAGMFVLSAVVADNPSIDQARQAMAEVVEHLDRQPITAEEVRRAQATLLSIRDRVLSDPLALGNVMAEGAAMGDWKLFFTQANRAATLRPADVQGAAGRYLQQATRINAQVVTAKADPARQTSMPATPSPQTDAPSPAPASLAPARVDAAGAADADIARLEADIQRFTLNGDMRVVMLPKASSGNRVRGVMKLRFGDERSLFAKRQIADLTASMLLRGSATLSYQQWVDRLNGMGAGIAVAQADDHVLVQFEASRATLPAVLESVSEMLRKPVFPDNELQILRQQRDIQLKQQRTVLSAVASEALVQHTNPYPPGDIRRPSSIDEALSGNAGVTRQDLVAFHAGFYGADHGELVIIGDFDPRLARQTLERTLGNWTSRAAYQRPPRPFHAPQPGVFHVSVPDKAHGQYLALLRLPLKDDSREALAITVANRLLGGAALSGRLIDRLRHQEGLSYTASTSVNFSIWEHSGNLIIAATYPPAQREHVRAVVHEELTRLVRDGVTADEVRHAQASLLQQSRQNRRQDEGLMGRLLLLARMGKTSQAMAEREASLASLTVDEVNLAIRQHLDPARLVQVFVDAGGTTP